MNNAFNNNGQNQNFNQQVNQGFNQQQQQGYQQGYPQQNFNQMQQQQNFGGQPQQQFQQQQPVPPHSVPGSNVMQGSFTMESAGIPANSGGGFSANKNPNVQEVPIGPQFGRIYSIVDLGSQMNNYKGNISYKRTVKISIEFPQYLQQFYLDKPDLKPTSIMQDYTMSTADGAHLTKLIKAAEGRSLSAEELRVYDYVNLLGKVLLFTVEHKPSSKDSSKIFVNIENVSGLGSLPMLPEFNNPQIPRNPLTLFFLGDNCVNLQTEYFANLPLFLRRKIVESQEVIEYLAKGGQIFRNDNNAKDNFYGTQNSPANGNSGFSQPTNQSHNFSQQPPQQNNPYQNPQNGNQPNAGGFGQPQQFNQPQSPQGFDQQYAQPNQQFGQQAPMQQQGFGQAPQQDFNQQPQQQQFQQSAPQQQFGGQQQDFNQGQQFQQQAPQAQHPFGQQASQNDFGQVSTQMQQATQMIQQQFGGQPQQEQFSQQQEQAPQNGGFSMGGNDDDLPF